MGTEDRLAPNNSCVLILAPIGQDARMASQVLRDAGIPSEIMRSLPDLCQRLQEPAAAIVLTEEPLTIEDSPLLRASLGRQEKWSDIPIILLTSRRERVFNTGKIMEYFSPAGNISLLERPFRIVTLVSAVQTALRARLRQYQVRDLINDQQDSLRQRDEFLSVASHELKTPLTSLKLQMQLRKRLLRQGDVSVLTPERVKSLIEVTENQVNRLSRLVDDMLDISRIVNGKLALNCESVELGALVRQVLDAFSAQFKAAGVKVRVSQKEAVRGNWDRYRIEQVVTNLLTNALKYGQGKPIRVIVRQQPHRLAELIVRDQGLGISREDLPRIFERFERAESGKHLSGLGLGLYITRQILDLHGGSIRVKSGLGKGSTFAILLPALP